MSSSIDTEISDTFCIDWRSRDINTFPEKLANIQDTYRVQVLKLDHNNISVIPDTLNGHFTNLESLSLVGNQIGHVTDAIENIRCLKHLDLSENLINLLPETLGNLQHLETLKLIGNKILWLPNKMGCLKKLKVFQFEENCITVLPDTIGDLCKLEVFEGNYNKLTMIPHSFGNLVNLRVCLLNNNSLKDIPHTFGNLKKLEVLDLSHNAINSLPTKCKFCETLQRLYLHNNLLDVLPRWVNHLPHIIEFNIRDNQIRTGLSASFGLCNKLVTNVDFSGNYLTKLPRSFGELKLLQTLSLGSTIAEIERRAFQNGNCISKLPTSFADMTSLRELHLDENRLTSLPYQIGCLKSLQFIDLGQNMLYSIPDSFADLTNLTQCYIPKNHLVRLPDEFGKLVKLEELRLEHNNLQCLPESMRYLLNVRMLDLFDNQLQLVPFVITDFPHIIHLNIRKNMVQPNAGMPLFIGKNISYTSRDPSLSNTWRGRRQGEADRASHPATVKFESFVNGDDKATTIPDLSRKFSEKFLMNIAEQQLTSDNKHNVYGYNNYTPSWLRGDEERLWSPTEGYDRDDQSSAGVEECGDESSESSVESMTELSSDEETQDQPVTHAVSYAVHGTDHCEERVVDVEDWDKEIEELYHNQEVPVYRQQTNAVINHSFIFVPDDLHAPNFVKRQQTFAVVDGQYDDAD